MGLGGLGLRDGREGIGITVPAVVRGLTPMFLKMTSGRWCFWLALGAALVAGRVWAQVAQPQAYDTAGANSTAAAMAANNTVAVAPSAAEVKEGNAAYVWRSVAIVAGGYVPGIVFSPAKAGLIYCRTDIGGFYKWDAEKKAWEPLTDWVGPGEGNLLGGESIAPDPVDANTVYLAAGMYPSGRAAILRSHDGGKSFQIAWVPFTMGGNSDGRSVGERLAVDPNDTRVLYFGSRNAGLWKSEDAAVTWKKVESFPVQGGSGGGGAGGGRGAGGGGIGWVVFDPRGGTSGTPTSSIYAGVAEGAGDRLYHSADAGKTWQAVAGQPKNLVPEHAAVDASGVVYIAYANVAGPNGATNGAVWKYDPAAKSGAWTDITPPQAAASAGRRGGGNGGAATTGGGFSAVSLDRQKPGTLIVSTLDHWGPIDDIYRSTDGGKTWKPVQAAAKMDVSLSPYLNWGRGAPRFGWWISAAAIDPFDSNHLLYGTGATIYGTEDLTNLDKGQPVHVAVAAKGIEETAVLALISPPSGAHLLSGEGDIGGFTHDDLSVSPPSGMHSNPLFTNENTLDYAELSPNVVVRTGTGGRGATMAYSEDGGETWRPVTGPGGGAALPSGRAGAGGRGGGGPRGGLIVSSDGATVLATGGGNAAISTDKGRTWTACAGLPAGVAPLADRASAKKFYALDAATNTMYVSTNGGGNFTGQAVSGLTGAGRGGQGGRGRGGAGGGMSLKSTPGIEGDLLLVEGGRLLHSTDGGATFAAVATRANVSGGNRFGYGKAAPGKTYPALYMAGTVDGKQGVFRSDDGGATWVYLYDEQHQFGGLPTVVTGDPRVYGRVYIGTNGRGILEGEPVGN